MIWLGSSEGLGPQWQVFEGHFCYKSGGHLKGAQSNIEGAAFWVSVVFEGASINLNPPLVT